MNKNGSILVLFIPTFLAMFALLLFVSRCGHGIYTAEKAETTARASVLSSLRIKVEGLQQIAEKWEPLRPFLLRGSSEGAVVPSSQWDKVLQLSDDLKKSLPGYKGRIKAVVSVVLDANELNRQTVQFADKNVFELDLASQGQWLVDPAGGHTWAEGLWVQRTWDTGSRLGRASSPAVHEVVFSDPTFGTIQRKVAARVGWDVSLNNSLVRSKGNGGFPRNWEEALDGSAVDPFRYPYFRVESLSQQGDVYEE
jgi:hypothetical protein